MATTTTWALKLRNDGLYLTERRTLTNMAGIAKRFRTVIGAAEYRERMVAGSCYTVVKLTKRSGVDLSLYRVQKQILACWEACA